MKKPQLRIIFCLTKKDESDLDFDFISEKLNLTPTETSSPSLSKGRINCKSDNYSLEELNGLTLIANENSSYQILKNAFWSLESDVSYSWSFDELLHWLKIQLFGKEEQIIKLCKEKNLFVSLIMKVKTKSNNLPELSFSNQNIKFISSIGASMQFDLSLY